MGVEALYGASLLGYRQRPQQAQQANANQLQGSYGQQAANAAQSQMSATEMQVRYQMLLAARAANVDISQLMNARPNGFVQVSGVADIAPFTKEKIDAETPRHTESGNAGVRVIGCRTEAAEAGETTWTSIRFHHQHDGGDAASNNAADDALDSLRRWNASQTKSQPPFKLTLKNSPLFGFLRWDFESPFSKLHRRLVRWALRTRRGMA